MYDVIIVGGGPGGITAALYTVRANLNTLLLESQFLGGNPSYADLVENYPGFPDGIKGFELGQRMAKQLENVGADIKMAEVEKIDFDTMTVYTRTEEFKTKTIILSMGLKHKELGIPTEKEFRGKGVVYCTVCDGPLYKDRKTVVAGLGIPAITSALYLDEIAKDVVLVTSSEDLKAKEEVFLERIKDSGVKVITNSVVKELQGGARLERVIIEDKATGNRQVIEAEGIFVNIGKVPNTKFLEGTGIEMTKKGFIKVGDKQETSIEGVYAVGDVTNAPYKQISTAVGDGCKAALNISKLLGKR
ncbi:MAG TPA: FAD-dependent oxidoreductase [Candidatus Methanofastidiosa archaeon]|nr:FAD-dependent oxidoreductase [Candidatus Methanofastidiosa archaeon]HPR41757.1 FAD-dependent oxidoreductase [Candidatus Methanofastidiosa archaeon]